MVKKYNNKRKSKNIKRKNSRVKKTVRWLDFVKQTHKTHKNHKGWKFSDSLKEAGKKWKTYKVKGGNVDVNMTAPPPPPPSPPIEQKPTPEPAVELKEPAQITPPSPPVEVQQPAAVADEPEQIPV